MPWRGSAPGSGRQIGSSAQVLRGDSQRAQGRRTSVTSKGKDFALSLGPELGPLDGERFLEPGDEVTIAAEGLGALTAAIA